MQPSSDRASIKAHKIVHADLDQPFAFNQVKTGNLAVFLIKAASVDQAFDSRRIQIRKRNYAAAGLIRPPWLQSLQSGLRRSC